MAVIPIRPIIIDGNIARVPLTRGLVAIIDADDVPLVENHNWYVYRVCRTLYAARNSSKADTTKRRKILMHRVILDPPDGLDVDHVNNDGIDNRRINLRGATRSENKANIRTPSNNTSGFKGVDWQKRDKKWRARLGIKGKFISLGYFTCPVEAHQAYIAASLRHYGTFAHDGISPVGDTISIRS